MDTTLNKWVLRCGRYLLLAIFLASPIVAVAALASVDVSGITRVSPTTIGAMESVGTGLEIPIAAPTGLAVYRI